MDFIKPTHKIGKPDGPEQSILQDLRNMVQRVDRRSSYYIEPTWLINGVPISQCVNTGHYQPLPAPPSECTDTCKLKRSFKEELRQLRCSELREIIMNAALKSFDAHREVVRILKRLHEKKPRTLGQGIQRPNVGLYLYCRNQGELVDIVLELARLDITGHFNQDVQDLITVMQEQGDDATDYR
ncbi:hypothetical protein GGS20DRAFT_560161 [Poronia punctata]|nr:hypothetical protein GGS20DRAFT_560161 [Poronia punctata]